VRNDSAAGAVGAGEGGFRLTCAAIALMQRGRAALSAPLPAKKTAARRDRRAFRVPGAGVVAAARAGIRATAPASAFTLVQWLLMGRIHFCKVGCGDCTVIQGASHTFLIDCYGIEKHASLLPASKSLRGVFITHQHTDHFAGMEYLKNNGYSIDCLIYSPYERRYNDNSVTYDEWKDFERLRDHFVNKGTKTWTPYRQDDVSKTFWDIDGISFRILAPFKDLAQSDTREIHDACLVVHVTAGSQKFLVCGDASDSSLNKLAKNTTNYCNGVLRCSHHGSDNNADLDFVKGANANYTMVSTEAGVYPNVPGATAMQRYRSHTKQAVYRTDTDGGKYWDF